jgi:hypothetical protein
VPDVQEVPTEVTLVDRLLRDDHSRNVFSLDLLAEHPATGDAGRVDSSLLQQLQLTHQVGRQRQAGLRL